MCHNTPTTSLGNKLTPRDPHKDDMGRRVPVCFDEYCTVPVIQGCFTEYPRNVCVLPGSPVLDGHGTGMFHGMFVHVSEETGKGHHDMFHDMFVH